MRCASSPWPKRPLRRSAGEIAAADEAYRQALALARKLGARLIVVAILNNPVRLQVATDRPALAQQYAQACPPLVHHEKVGVDLLEASVGLAACRGEHRLAPRCRPCRLACADFGPVAA